MTHIFTRHVHGCLPQFSSNHPLVALILVLLISHSLVSADFGDAVDPSFDCPAFTTCKQVCVPTVQDCPATMTCPLNQTLCNDGSCASVCDPQLVSPCVYGCASVACPKVDASFDSCVSVYGAWYDNETACAESESELLATYSLREPVFLAAYAWIGGLTVSLLVWCAYNQRIAPVAAAAQPLHVQTVKEEVYSWQTGYYQHPVGLLLHGWTLLTLFGFHIILGWLTVQYYIQQGMILNPSFVGRFQDEANLLAVFEILWVVGFVFSFALKWPYSLQSIFLRRCELNRATHVAVCIVKVNDNATDQETFHDGYMFVLRLVLKKVRTAISFVMTLLFSDVDQYGHKKGKNGAYKVCRVQRDSLGGRFFVFGFRHYNFDAETRRFQPGIFSIGLTLADHVVAGTRKGGLSTEEVDARRRVVGPNAIEMEKPSILKIVLNEFSKPFYTYQAFMVWTWFPLWYYYMALTLAIVVTTGGLTVSFFHYRSKRKLYEITHLTGEVSVVRDGELQCTSPKDIVPGDIVAVQPGLTYCDMVVVESSTLLVDESALTGEATPMLKTAVDPTEGKVAYQPTKHKRHTILAGTHVLETEETLAVVTQTASYTTRGEFIRDIYAYKRHQFKFDVEVPIVITLLAFYAVFGFGMVYFFIKDALVYSWFYGMFVVATVLPPLLPTVFTVSVGISSDRLAYKHISCVNPDAILVAGKVDLAFFDKTGTLTKQGMNLVVAKPQTGLEAEFAMAMASCHTLTKMQNGELAGNPVDREMFEQSGASVVSASGPVYQVTDRFGQTATIVRHFDFDHHRMTQTVIVKMASDGSLIAFVKGSGESIKKLCDKESIPCDFDRALEESAHSGIYQISVATKKLQATINVSKMTRDDVEGNLTFAGAVDFKNVLRTESSDVIAHLKNGRVKTIMLTGDSILTGICIGKEVGILNPQSEILVGRCNDTGSLYWSTLQGNQCDLPSMDILYREQTKLAISGEAWGALQETESKQLPRLMEHICVYGRCTPYDKVSVVDAYNKLGHITLMCGDGGNDCGALRTAHVGVALSDAEASTVAPFTSLDKSITASEKVLLEGRCSLASSLASYKFMIMYGQIATINQLINAYFSTSFTEWCWVFMDGIWVMTLAFTLPLARSTERLSKTWPTASLLGPQTLASVLGIMCLNFVCLVGSLSYLWHQDWFQCRKWDNQDVSNVLVIGDNYETEVMFLVTGYQYVSSAMAFSFGYEWRQAWYRNYLFVCLFLVYTILQFYITLVPGYLSCVWRVNCDNEHVLPAITSGEPMPIQNSYNTTVMPSDFARGLIGIMVANAIANWTWEYCIVNGIRRRYAALRSDGCDRVRDTELIGREQPQKDDSKELSDTNVDLDA